MDSTKRSFFKFKSLNGTQQVAWYSASLTLGLTLVLVGAFNSAFTGPSFAFPFFVFCLSWLIGVVLLRRYIQDVDPTSLRSILGLQRRKP